MQLPYAAWRQLGDLAVKILYDAYLDLCGDNTEELMKQDYAHFNETLLIFLPKTAVGLTEDGKQFFDPSGVRPFNITNADNRLLARAGAWHRNQYWAPSSRLTRGVS